jgi:hypothetical protein
MANEKTQTPVTKKTESPATKMVLKGVRFSYVHVFEPTAMEGSDKKKYSVSILIPKENTALVEQIKAGIEAAKKQGLTDKWGGKLPANLKMPLRDGDIEKTDNEGYAGHYFMSASSNSKPGIVDKAVAPITDESQFYSGCWGNASINFFPFNTNGAKGIACGLNHVQKVKDGEPLGGRGSAEDDFEVEEDGEDLA